MPQRVLLKEGKPLNGLGMVVLFAVQPAAGVAKLLRGIENSRPHRITGIHSGITMSLQNPLQLIVVPGADQVIDLLPGRMRPEDRLARLIKQIGTIIHDVSLNGTDGRRADGTHYNTKPDAKRVEAALNSTTIT